MPQLNANDWAEVARIIDELEPEVGGFSYDAANNFVRDQVERKRQYGERMFISEKQIAWLKRLHEEYIGDTAHEQEDDGDLDMNDKIPF